MNEIKKVYVDIDNARDDSQREILRKIIESGDDPFDPENLLKYHNKPILIKGKYWWATENQWPYKGSKKHFFLIYVKKYIDSIQEIPSEAFVELIQIVQRLSMEHSIIGGGLCMRFGDTKKTGATVKRLHVQLIEPDMDSDKQVVFYFGEPNSLRKEAKSE